jgi:hypothetical protein
MHETLALRKPRSNNERRDRAFGEVLMQSAPKADGLAIPERIIPSD